MENKEEMVTEPAVKETAETEETKTYTQEDFNNVVAKESKKAMEKVLKDLGVEDFKSAKEGLAKAKEIQEAQKTDFEKALERAEMAEKRIAEFESKEKDRETQEKISEILKSKDIDTKYAKTIKKLIGNADEISEELVLQTINDELPILVSDSQIKIGVEKNEEDAMPKNNVYLEAFKKMKL